MTLDDIRIVLVNTSHSGNIGSAARAMKTMGLSNLYLVDPACEIDSHASALAAGATDVLGKAVVVDTLADAIADCSLTIGTSARSRTLSWPMVEPRECGEKLVAEAEHGPVALVFGRENSGLTNEELQQCNYHVCIPANPEYSSLNLAMAVQTLCYETRMAYLNKQPKAQEEDEATYPNAKQTELFYEHLEQTLNDTGFIIKQHPGMVMTKLRRLFNRARPEEAEMNILRGILTSINKSIK
ncbi:tRNA (cytosine(32)/uridine(32)-2'-O)-methyltransferase TrmJ [Pseudoalteromonas shioyasakiensis]|uniref:tRNA (cytosine(32)/uridine(32)-2'-O)-methyltransferase TrmJ n=1 Tax=Pseudoalteromonas TaxID=53246 RepID=UPI000C8E1DE3|nr:MULTISPECIES: tRNA (cytosine(32)/uridine(32)-2'-O)-methyltransferase TrmJ [Pseudoalteromonas]MAD02145.1 tRNA (cytosine(32)/uridine(32)-2'-O)-methyltransferase TrmJ [Pseudoalteromonas sp.]MCP4587317.1 tRNA (cytosine(32)/uridine(32)-2'-O)-methyltransferase TrmJ [Pseudoalteromonas sp.]MCQ8881356.1 tRNA (cytosine(32)/uridine(32)-2'-O)-methyltransferase TrmJ [Pseudoalteromonas shioyasakiensis]NIZ06040.1 tRNA (cytosine(32)/uridine(32)-2'-O)-methyltransferase TrmJ [Pseudoalteromonas sp. HF66]QLE07|tara:strand:+ start:93 stop:815 length:723 start_codon:yes stop_codon:yes gene_type:complete|eukprot:gnl/Carplike_NY0171/2891_a3887_471.p1 GENE.gnl/Carplike_NY0171/2891_a3887_471~~gnl/Carplike_NY0171/2891_a3887_471.p1  ORF type:complete len:241 (-),score=21.14 gnl/Carplike_NY0171/2891_a3887_471:142-864(-)